VCAALAVVVFGNRFEFVVVVVDVDVFLSFFSQLSDSCANWKGKNKI
jgi:hypothetical protein